MKNIVLVRRLCGGLWVGGCLQDLNKGWLQRQHRPESHFGE